MDDYNPKKVNIPYTIGILKPDLAQQEAKVQEILAKIEASGFSVLNILKKELTKQEVLNLYYKHSEKDFFDNMAKFLMNGDSIILLLTAEDADPIKKWKSFIGVPEPTEAKKSSPDSLRALYGTTLIKNAAHGSDNDDDANKEREIFKFPVPQRVPEFKFEKFKLTLDMLLKFLYPANLEHSSINSRLDIFAMYGPVVNQHSVDTCFCRPCAKLGKEHLQRVIAEKIDDKKRKLGISTKPTSTLTNKTGTSLGSTGGSGKLQMAPLRLIDEKGIIELWPELCEKCRDHCENYVHLTCGREQQHIMSDHEIKELTYEINRRELHAGLKKEKGSTADVMIEYLDIKEPEETQYNRKLVKLLFKSLPTDYYERYNFLEMQNVILEDRRIRLNAWVAKLIGKPLDKFVNPKLLEVEVAEERRHDPKDVNFVLNRTEPLSYSVKPKNINEVPIKFAETIVDKKKLLQNEEKIVLFKLLHRNSHHIVSIDEVNKGNSFVNSMYLMRDGYNDGRNGSWNNYATLKGINKGSYVKTTTNQKKSLLG
jgi:nucleoside diphosphate kinase